MLTKAEKVERLRAMARGLYAKATDIRKSMDDPRLVPCSRELMGVGAADADATASLLEECVQLLEPRAPATGYLVARGNDAGNLAEDVCRLMARGWRPWYAPVTYAGYLYQAMVKMPEDGE